MSGLDHVWVARNDDKPWRCPKCHSIRTWDHKRYGPRTVLRCCGVRWRIGVRYRLQMRTMQDRVKYGITTPPSRKRK